MTPNKQLIFETREEAREYWQMNVPSDKWITKRIMNAGMFKEFTQWLSEQNVIIKSEVKE